MVLALGFGLVGATPSPSAELLLPEAGACCAAEQSVDENAPRNAGCPESCGCGGFCAACPCCNHCPVAVLTLLATSGVSMPAAVSDGPPARRGARLPTSPEVPPPRHGL